MVWLFSIIALSLYIGQVTPSPNATILKINAAAPSDAGVPLDGFVSYSIEFSSFPDFAGNLSHPNTYSDNLLNNLAEFTGTKPYIRVGGNTQDYPLYNASQQTALIGTVDPSRSPDYPTTITIGPSYFESYSTWPSTRYIHGFNLGKNSSEARTSLLATVPLVCRALQDNNKLAYWEYGNEPDLFKTSSQGPVRLPNWNEPSYVAEWLNGTRAIRQAMQQACPNLTSAAAYKYYAPSFAGTSNSLNPILTWEAGLDADKDVALISSHNYIGGATQPGVTLQGTLMNHSSTVASIAKQLNESRLLAALPTSLNPDLPFILGETNSLYNQGKPGLSDSFGAALWGVDFNLWCAANNISRVHMHQGTNYRYASWQPITTSLSPIGTKAPYYGNIAVAAFLGKYTSSKLQIVNLPLRSERQAAYAAYVDGRVARLMLVDMNAYNATNNYTDTFARPVEKFEVSVPWEKSGGRSGRKEVGVRRLLAAGSDAVDGITFDGISYDWELDEGRPVRLSNVTVGETLKVSKGGRLEVEVPWSSAVIIDLV